MLWMSHLRIYNDDVIKFRVTGPLCGEFTGHWWIPLTKVSDAKLWCFLWSATYCSNRVQLQNTLREVFIELLLLNNSLYNYMLFIKWNSGHVQFTINNNDSTDMIIPNHWSSTIKWSRSLNWRKMFVSESDSIVISTNERASPCDGILH